MKRRMIWMCFVVVSLYTFVACNAESLDKETSVKSGQESIEVSKQENNFIYDHQGLVYDKEHDHVDVDEIIIDWEPMSAREKEIIDGFNPNSDVRDLEAYCKDHCNEIKGNLAQYGLWGNLLEEYVHVDEYRNLLALDNLLEIRNFFSAVDYYFFNRNRFITMVNLNVYVLDPDKKKAYNKKLIDLLEVMEMTAEDFVEESSSGNLNEVLFEITFDKGHLNRYIGDYQASYDAFRSSIEMEVEFSSRYSTRLDVRYYETAKAAILNKDRENAEKYSDLFFKSGYTGVNALQLQLMYLAQFDKENPAIDGLVSELEDLYKVSNENVSDLLMVLIHYTDMIEDYEKMDEYVNALLIRDIGRSMEVISMGYGSKVDVSAWLDILEARFNRLWPEQKEIEAYFESVRWAQ